MVLLGGSGGNALSNMVKAEQLRDEIIGIIPVYSEIGNATDVLLKNGEVVRDKRILNSVIKALAAAYAIDLKAQRQGLRKHLNCKGIIPFHLGTNRVFIPLKLRRAISKNDAVYGYVDMNYLSEPQARPNKEFLICLTNGLSLRVLSNRATIYGALHAGRAVLEIIRPVKAADYGEPVRIMEAGQILACAIMGLMEQLNRIEQSISKRNV